MNIVQVNNLIKKIHSVDKRIRTYIENNSQMKVIIMGVTGCGKSSITGSLMNKDVRIGIGKGGKVELIGNGIGSGSRSITQDLNIEIDSNLQIIYCDCPGFEDTEGYFQEIIDSYVIYCLFKNHQNYNSSKFKILLIVSTSEIDASRGQSVSQSLNRIHENVSIN